MLPVEQPFKTYTGLDGKPLTDGSVYFGITGQDPITHPVTVYWDAAGTLPASQPLQTVNGYIVNDSGSPANVFYDSAYSETVLDSKGRQVFYAPTSDDFSIASFVLGLAKSAGASLIGFIQSGIGAVRQTVQDALRERMSMAQFLPEGYVTDGSVDYTTQLQAFINAAIARNAVARGIEGVFQVSETGLTINGPLTLRGTGRDSCFIKNNSGNVLRIQGAGVDVSDITLWSVGGGHTVVQTGAFSQSNWTHYRIRQDAADYSGWDNADFEYVDNRRSHFDYVHAQGSTEPFFNLVAAGGLINDNEWRAGRTNNSGIHFFRIRSTSANWQYANKFDKITFEVCKGGGIDLQGAMLFEINDCQNWDCGANSITNHFYSIQLNADSIGSVGRIRSCGRWAGGNVAGIYDVQLPAGGGGAGISIEDCTTSGGGDPFTVDCRNNNVLVHGTTPTLMSLVNADGCLSLQASGAKPGLQWAAGNANIYSNVADTVSTDGTLTVGVNLVAGVAAAFGGTHTVRKDSATLWTMWLLNGSATPRGLNIAYDGAAPNSTTSQFIQCGDSGAVRMEVRSNGGIANFSANDVNLSDVRLKTDIVPAASYWDKVKAIEVVTYRYKDQTDPALNLGVIAQQVQSVAPELVDTSGFGKPQEGGAPYMAVYQTDLGFAAIKALQEVMARLEALEAKVQ
jgi:hypothetical protein